MGGVEGERVGGEGVIWKKNEVHYFSALDVFPFKTKSQVNSITRIHGNGIIILRETKVITLKEETANTSHRNKMNEH